MRARSTDLCGRTTLGGFAALLRGAALLVGNDSGPAHVAAAVGVPSVTVFLSGDPVRWAHPGARHRVARVQVECNPCPHLTCPIDHRCAARLTVADVLAEVERAVGRAAAVSVTRTPPAAPA
jgi:ADP-heptose:LPS heptosyltransferase